jgi:hypothetical protein
MSKTTLLELSKLAGAIPGRGDKINWPSLEGSADGSGSAKQDQLSPPNALRLLGRIAVGGGDAAARLVQLSILDALLSAVGQKARNSRRKRKREFKSGRD